MFQNGMFVSSDTARTVWKGREEVRAVARVGEGVMVVAEDERLDLLGEASHVLLIGLGAQGRGGRVGRQQIDVAGVRRVLPLEIGHHLRQPVERPGTGSSTMW